MASSDYGNVSHSFENIQFQLDMWKDRKGLSEGRRKILATRIESLANDVASARSIPSAERTKLEASVRRFLSEVSDESIANVADASARIDTIFKDLGKFSKESTAPSTQHAASRNKEASGSPHAEQTSELLLKVSGGDLSDRDIKSIAARIKDPLSKFIKRVWYSEHPQFSFRYRIDEFPPTVQRIVNEFFSKATLEQQERLFAELRLADNEAQLKVIADNEALIEVIIEHLPVGIEHLSLKGLNIGKDEMMDSIFFRLSNLKTLDVTGAKNYRLHYRANCNLSYLRDYRHVNVIGYNP